MLLISWTNASKCLYIEENVHFSVCERRKEYISSTKVGHRAVFHSMLLFSWSNSPTATVFCVSTRLFFWIVIGLHSIIFCHKETTVCVFTLWTPADMFWLKVSPVWNWKKGSFMHAQPDTIRALLWNVVSNPLTDWSNEKIPKIDLNASVLFWHSATKN